MRCRALHLLVLEGSETAELLLTHATRDSGSGFRLKRFLDDGAS